MRRLTEPQYAEAMRDAQETFDHELSSRTDTTVSRPQTADRLSLHPSKTDPPAAAVRSTARLGRP